jgi:hypothetical protein
MGVFPRKDFKNAMAQFRSFSPGVLVNGQTVLSVVDGMGSFAQTAVAVLARHGIKQPTPAGWYPQQAWLDSFEEIAKSIGPRTLNQIGQSIPKNARFPVGVNSVEDSLASLDDAYHMNHRGGEIGHYVFKKTGAKSGQIECNNPYPCEFDLGIVQAIAKRFAAPGAQIEVVHDPAKPCRSRQGESCTFLVTW